MSEEAREQAARFYEQIEQESALRRAENNVAAEQKKEHECQLNRSWVQASISSSFRIVDLEFKKSCIYFHHYNKFMC
jgi:hypothetical protein